MVKEYFDFGPEDPSVRRAREQAEYNLNSEENCAFFTRFRWWKPSGWFRMHRIDITHIPFGTEWVDHGNGTASGVTGYKSDMVEELKEWLLANTRGSFRMVLPYTGSGARPARIWFSNLDDLAFFKLSYGGT